MGLGELLEAVGELFSHHVPGMAGWAPTAVLAGLSVAGLILLLRGAALTPMLAGAACGVCGLVGGAAAGSAAGWPVWPVALGGLVIGAVAGVALLRLWLALLVSACAALLLTSAYSARFVFPHLRTFSTAGYDAEQGLNTLPPPGSLDMQAAGPRAQLAALWQHLRDNVPRLELGLGGLALLGGLLGLLVGLTAPRFSRALWAATAGTFLALLGVTGLLQAYWPAALERLEGLGSWGWAVIGGVWLASLVLNMVTCPRPGARRRDEQAVPAAA